jgi:hypothetical protein
VLLHLPSHLPQLPKCHERNVVKDGYFVCAICGGELPSPWNFSQFTERRDRLAAGQYGKERPAMPQYSGQTTSRKFTGPRST